MFDSHEGVVEQNKQKQQYRKVKPSFQLGGDQSPVVKVDRVTRIRRTTISNTAELNEIEKAKTASPYTNLYNLNLEQAKKLGLTDISGNILDKRVLLRKEIPETNNTDIRKSKSSPALISKAVRNIPVQAQASETNNSLNVLLKHLAKDNIQEDLLSTLPSPCFKLVNSPPSPRFFPTGELTPPPGVFFSASPASWQEVVEMRKRLDSGESVKRNLVRTSSMDSCDKENNLHTGKTFSRSKSDVSLPVNNKRRDESPVFTDRSNFYGSPLESTISMELNKDLALEPIPPHSPPDFIEDSLLSKEHAMALEEVEFLLTLSETLLALTTDTALSGHMSDLVSDLKNKHSMLTPSHEAFKHAKLLMVTEALRVASYALKFTQTHQKRGTTKSTATLKKGMDVHISYKTGSTSCATCFFLLVYEMFKIVSSL